jgi:hypothetical protein
LYFQQCRIQAKEDSTAIQAVIRQTLGVGEQKLKKYAQQIIINPPDLLPSNMLQF